MNVFDSIGNRFRRAAVSTPKATQRIMSEAADRIVEGIKARAPVDTGALRNSVRQHTDIEHRRVTSYIVADAANEKSGDEYAVFLEMGTGLFAENGDGRKTPWVYQDRHGNWHYTRGMKPRPFIRPAVAAELPRLNEELRREVRTVLLEGDYRHTGGGRT